jgi:hypothetical protein
MPDGTRYSRFELDERDPRLFRRPQERALVLKRPGRPDLKLSVVLAYVEGSLRAQINGAYTFAGGREKPDPPWPSPVLGSATRRRRAIIRCGRGSRAAPGGKALVPRSKVRRRRW